MVAYTPALSMILLSACHTGICHSDLGMCSCHMSRRCMWLCTISSLSCFTAQIMLLNIFACSSALMPCASEAPGLSPVALLILTYLRVQTYTGSLRLSRLAPQTDRRHSFRAAPQTDLVTSACMLSSECLCLDALHALSTYGSTSARSRLLFSLLFQV